MDERKWLSDRPNEAERINNFRILAQGVALEDYNTIKKAITHFN
jgi:hypothetical protein